MTFQFVTNSVFIHLMLTNQLLVSNCLTLMENMIRSKEMVDIIITDPPYGVGFNYDTYDDTFENWKSLISQFLPLALQVSRTSVIFPVGKFKGEKWLYCNFDPLWRICWYKGASPIRSFIGWQDWELLMVFGNKPKNNMHDFFSAFPMKMSMDEMFLGHPCPKPLGYSEWLIKNTTDPGDLVFDPFCGSGTTLVSAKSLNRSYLGCDISEKYVSIAQNALNVTERRNIQKKKLAKSLSLF